MNEPLTKEDLREAVDRQTLRLTIRLGAIIIIGFSVLIYMGA